MHMTKNSDSSHLSGASSAYSPYECPGQICCMQCTWAASNGGYCAGCDSEYQMRCLKRICSFSCGICSGGKHASVPGCCGRAPESWREPWDKLFEYQITERTPAPLQLDCRLIPVIRHEIRNLRIPEQFPQIDAWAVLIHKVASRKGQFRSNDLKDYLGLPSNRKLILSTCAPDDYEEMLWEKGPRMDYARHCIDYWFPAHFSVYDNDSKLYQFASAKRQQIHAVWTESQFAWFRLGEHIPVEFLSPIRKTPSILISTNQMYSNHNRAILHNEVKIADRWFPPETVFFVVGGLRNLPIKSERVCYEINSTWVMRGLQGYNLAGKYDKRFTRPDVLRNNLKEALVRVDAS